MRLSILVFLLICIFGLHAQNIHTIAGTGTASFSSGSGIATASPLNHPYDVAVDPAGNVYIADAYNHRIRKVTPTGIMSTIAGVSGAGSFGGDSGPATAANLNGPHYLTLDAAGNIYFSDMGNNRIRKINTSGTISTIAGNGGTGYMSSDTIATATMLNNPRGLAVDGAGNIYFADELNNCIRKVTVAGIIHTIAGNGTPAFGGDGGPASAALLNGPMGVTMDASGNVIFADCNNHRIRKITPSGGIATVAGTGTPGFWGDGAAATAARIHFPYGVTVDAAGNIYFCDAANEHIRKVSISGNISSVAGLDTTAGLYGGDGGPATIAELNVPSGVAVWNGSIYIADGGNQRIRKVDTCAVWPTVPAISGPSSICLGHTATYTDATAGGMWWINDTTIASTSGGGLVHGLNAGQATVNYGLSNTCGSVWVSDTFTVVNAAFAGGIMGDPSVCAGASTSLFESVPGGSWHSLNTAIATVSGTGLVSGVDTGTTMIKYVVTNACGSDSTTAPISVLAPPGPPTIAPVDTICPGQMVTLTANPAGGAWVSTNAPVAAFTSMMGSLLGLADGTDTIIYISSNICGAASDTVAMHVGGLPGCPTEVPTVLTSEPRLSIYPEPNDGDFVVKLNSGQNSVAQFMICNAIGAKVFEGTLVSNLELEVSLKMPSGVYLLTVYSEGGKMVRVVVVR